MAFNPIVFQLPSDPDVAIIAADMQANPLYENLFDSGDLRLFVSPSEYKRVAEGESSKWINGYESTFTMHTARRIGLELSITDARAEIMRLLQTIARWSRSAKSTVTIRDYVYLEDDDAHTLGYTVRSGIITQIEPNGGSVRRTELTTSVRYGQGFRVQFWEQDLREYF